MGGSNFGRFSVFVLALAEPVRCNCSGQASQSLPLFLLGGLASFAYLCAETNSGRPRAHLDDFEGA